MTGDFAGGDRCPTCGKVRFRSRAQAKRVAKNMNRRNPGHLSAYRCGEFWHLGHLPSAVIAGDQSRAELGAAPQRHMRDKALHRGTEAREETGWTKTTTTNVPGEGAR